MESIPPSKRNTQADIQLRTRQTNHQQETDGCIQIKHNPEHQPSRMSSKSTAYVPPKTASTPTKANTQTCSYLDFNQFLSRRITRNICLRLRLKCLLFYVNTSQLSMLSVQRLPSYWPKSLKYWPIVCHHRHSLSQSCLLLCLLQSAVLHLAVFQVGPSITSITSATRQLRTCWLGRGAI